MVRPPDFAQLQDDRGFERLRCLRQCRQHDGDRRLAVGVGDEAGFERLAHRIDELVGLAKLNSRDSPATSLFDALTTISPSMARSAAGGP